MMRSAKRSKRCCIWGAGILLVGAVPGDGDRALRANYRSWVVNAIGNVFPEMLDRVGDPHHVVLGSALGHLRHLCLDLLMARIGAWVACVEFVARLADDLAAEAAGGALDRGDVVGIGRSGAFEQVP